MKTIEQLIKENEMLIYSILKYFPFYENKEDLFQAGCLGMVLAHKNFDPNYNIKFTTYAYQYILGEMRKLVREDKTIKINRNIQLLNLKIEKAKIVLSQTLMREATNEEISEFLEVPIELIETALTSPKKIISIDEPINDDGKEISLIDIIGEDINNKEELLMLKDELNKLSDNDRTILERRYFEGYTQSETAKILNMTQVQVSRQEQKILTKMKKSMVA